MKKSIAGVVACVAALALTLTLPALAVRQAGQMTLNGSVGTGEVISVTMPYKLLFTVTTKADKTVDSVLGATATVVNHSNCKVKLKITKVDDPDKLLEKVNLAFSHKENASAAEEKGTWLTAGETLNMELFTLAKPSGTAGAVLPQKIIRVSGEKKDTSKTIEAGSYTVTPTITIEAATAVTPIP